MKTDIFSSSSLQMICSTVLLFEKETSGTFCSIPFIPEHRRAILKCSFLSKKENNVVWGYGMTAQSKKRIFKF